MSIRFSVFTAYLHKVICFLLRSGGNVQVWVKQYSLGPYLLLPETLDPPKENCYICQSHKLILRLHSLRVSEKVCAKRYFCERL